MSLSTGVSVLLLQDLFISKVCHLRCLKHSSCICRVPHHCLWTGLHHCQTLDEWDVGRTQKFNVVLALPYIPWHMHILYKQNLWWVMSVLAFSRYPSWAMKMESWIPAPSSPSLTEEQRVLKETLVSFSPAWLHASTARWSCTHHRSFISFYLSSTSFLNSHVVIKTENLRSFTKDFTFTAQLVFWVRESICGAQKAMFHISICSNSCLCLEKK